MISKFKLDGKTYGIERKITYKLSTRAALLNNFKMFPNTWFKKDDLLGKEIYGKYLGPIDADRRLRELVTADWIEKRTKDGKTEYKLKVRVPLRFTTRPIVDERQERMAI